MGEEFIASRSFRLALARLMRAHMRGTGCHMTGEMVDAMALTVVAEWWTISDEQKRNAALKARAETD